MKIGFVTCVQLGLSCMEALYEAGAQLDIAVTIHDEMAKKKSGRIYLDEFCAKHCIPLLKVRHINDQTAIDKIQELEIDWLFIIGWSQIAGPQILKAARGAAIGIHPTLLPEGRGRAAIPWAIIKQLPKTGITMFKLDKGVDTGDIIAQKELKLPPDVDATWLYRRINDLHIELIKETLPRMVAGALILRPQDESKATYWEGRGPEDGRLDLHGSVTDAERLVRAVTNPYPGAFFDLNGNRTKVWKAKVVSQKTNGLCLEFKDGVLECIDYECFPIT